MDLAPVIEGLGLDPGALTESVLERVVVRLDEAGLLGDTGQPLDKLVAGALGDRLVDMIAAPGGPSRGEAPADSGRNRTMPDWLSDADADAAEYLGDGEEDYLEEDFEDYGSEDDGDGEASARDHRRKARREHDRRAYRALARRRAAMVGRQRQTGRPKSARAAVREVALEGAVRQDMVARALAQQRRSADGTAAALMATVVLRQMQSSFPTVMGSGDTTGSRLIQAVAGVAPLALLQPVQGGHIRRTQLLGLAAVAGTVAAAEFGKRSRKVEEVVITRSEVQLTAGNTYTFRAEARDGDGNVVPGTRIVWASDHETAAGIAEGKESGMIKALTPYQQAKITASVDGKSDSVLVQING